MKGFRLGWLTVVAAALIGTAAAEGPKQPQPPPTSTVKAAPSTSMTAQDPAVIKDIENTFGFMPAFLKSVPPTLLPQFWASLKMFQMGTETKLDGKTKELIGLAVAAQIPCEYCIQFHTEAARVNGASEQEIQEAVGMAALTREASTMLNGTMVDKVQFKKDVDRIMRKAKQQARK